MVTNRARQEIIWIAPNEKIPKFSQTTGTVEVFEAFQALRDPLCGELPPIKIFINDGPNPLM